MVTCETPNASQPAIQSNEMKTNKNIKSNTRTRRCWWQGKILKIMCAILGVKAMRYVFCFFFVISVSNICHGQNRIDPSPTCGWDSLKLFVVYPELAKRACLEDYAIVTVRIDSSGNVKNVNIRTQYDIFEEPIHVAVNRTKWIPAKVDGKVVDGEVSFPVLFLIKGLWDNHRLIIEGERPPIMKEQTY
jgi:TonB family protein